MMVERKLFMIILLALGLHALAIYSLHDLPIRFSSIAHTFLISENPEAPHQEGEAEKNKRQVWIEEYFCTMKKQNSSRELHIEFPQTDEQSACLEIPSLGEEALGFQVALSDPLDLTLSKMTGSSLLQTFQGVSAKTSEQLKEKEFPLLSPIFLPLTASEESKEEILNTDAFNFRLEYAPKGNEGYLFRISLFPKPHFDFKKIKQNFFFIIDRSSSIPVESYERAKKAVFNALKILNSESTFNILIFDHQVVRLSHQNLSLNKENLLKAKNFLTEQKHGGFFATTDLYSSLGDIIPEVVAENELNSAILLSDGDTFMSRDNQRKMIANWTKKNAGKVSLFCIAEGKANNVPLLHLLSDFNRGFFLYDENEGTIANALEKLLLLIQNPIGKDIAVTALSKNPRTNIALYPSLCRMPDLYKEIPYTMYGTLSDPSDFVLFLQGRYYDEPFDIKLKLSLPCGSEVPLAVLESKVALQQAYAHYEQYLNEGSLPSLMQAQKILTSYGFLKAFE